MAGAIGILADYRRTAAPIGAVRVAGTVVGERASGSLVVAAPVDYVSWTEGAGAYAQRPDLAAKDRQFWLTGHLSPCTPHELTARGWTIREGASAGIAHPVVRRASRRNPRRPRNDVRGAPWPWVGGHRHGDGQRGRHVFDCGDPNAHAGQREDP